MPSSQFRGPSAFSTRGAAARAAVGKLAALLTGRSDATNKKDDDDDLPGPNATVPMFSGLRLSGLRLSGLGLSSVGAGLALG